MLAFSIIASFNLIFLIFLNRQPNHHAPFDVPTFKTVVHGKVVKGKPEILYPLTPFPESPMRTGPFIGDYKHDQRPRLWLAAVICAASDIEQRMLIRSTWMRLFQDVPFDGRFVVSNPGPRYTDTVAFENQTFGDIVVLDHLQEDDVTANTVKTLEFYKWLTKRGTKYEFVSKMDTDLWLNARGFWDRFLAPRMVKVNDTENRADRPSSASVESWKSTISRTIIGELYYSRNGDLAFPHGGMYTATWDMVELLASLHDRFKVVTGEDMALSILMLKGRETANFINFRGTEKFDYDDQDSRGDGTAWARPNTHPDSTQHAIVGQYPIAVHQLKDKKLWLKVADCFDAHGIKSPTLGPYTTPPFLVSWFDIWYRLGLSRKYTSRFDMIPDNFWTLENGNWICDGIWNLGKAKTGFSDPLARTRE